MDKSTRLKDFPVEKENFLKDMNPDEFYAHLRDNIDEIQKKYVRGTKNILDGSTTEAMVEKLGSDIESLVLVDENDEYYRNADGFWASEFRQDYMNYHLLPDSKERTIFCRIILCILEDTAGNILVPRRSLKKNPRNILAIAGGHVTAGYSYLETCHKELDEELNMKTVSISDSDRLFKYRNRTKDPMPGTHGRGNILSIYRICIPNPEALIPNPAEISELITMTPEELFWTIKNRSLDENKNLQFDPMHACLYLEYLKMRGVMNTDVEQVILSNSLTKISTS